MAEGWTKNVPCRYFKIGICNKNDRCAYLHDSSLSKSSQVCRYYLMGNCIYGGHCIYDHIKPSHNTGSVNEKNKLLSTKPLQTVVNIPGSSIQLNQDLINSESHDLNWLSSEELVSPQTGMTNLLSYVVNMLSTDSSPLRSYAQVVKPKDDKEVPEGQLCPFAMMGECPFENECTYLHGEICELCGYACLHPNDEDQKKKHHQECIKAHERDMELSFAIARSCDKVCGICMDVVQDKLPKSERRFGILPNCTHTFCLSCIRKWRQARQFENHIIRSCPECRVESHFIVPSKFWVENKEEKDQLIQEYLKALSNKACKYFEEGRGECPFGNKCFYLHAYADGSPADIGPPRRRRRNADNESMLLWEFIEERDNRLLFAIDLFDQIYNDVHNSDDFNLGIDLLNINDCLD